MKRHESLVVLSHDHHHALVLAQVLKKNTPHRQGKPKTTEEKIGHAKDFYLDELRTHFEMEEEILFPAAKGKTHEIDDLLNEMLVEHRKIEVMVHELDVLEEKVDDKLDELGLLLESHVHREERELFEKLQLVMSQDELADIYSKFLAVKQSKEVPG